MAERSKGPGDFNIGKLLDPKRLDFQIKTPEHPAEREYRLRKEFLSFLVRDLSAYLLAVLIVLVVLAYCFRVLVVRDSTPQERGWAMSVLASTLTGAVGFAFGKSSK